MSLLVISRCYFPPHEVEAFSGHMMATARRVGLEPYRFGIGEQMSTHGGSGEGPGALQVLMERTEEYVLCCDCMDVAFLSGEDEIMDKFLDMGSDFIVSGEKCALRNMEKTSDVLQKHDGFFKEINVGLWIGKRTHAIEVLSEAIRRFRYHADTSGQDTLQTWLPLMYVAGDGPKFEIDRNCELFQSMNMVDQSEVVILGKRAFNTVTGTKPIALHYNGDKSRGSYFEMVETLLK